MIVEHVDLRKEEREERERKRKEEKRERSRARKSSRSSRSAADVASVYSVPLASPSPLPQVDSGFFSNPRDSRYSQSFSPRPSSVLTGGAERPQTLLRAQSQASFSDMQSLGSASPRRSRFFGFKNLSAAWQSRDSVAPSGSMMDMQCVVFCWCGDRLRRSLHCYPVLRCSRSSRILLPIPPRSTSATLPRCVRHNRGPGLSPPRRQLHQSFLHQRRRRTG